MSRDPLSAKVKRILKGAFGDKGDVIVVRNGYQDFLHLYVISAKFKNKRVSERSDMIWSLLFSELQEEEWGRITPVAGLTPDEVDPALEPELRGVKIP